MTFTPGSPLNDGDDPTSEEGLKEIIEERDKRLKDLYDEVTYRDKEFEKIQKDRTQEEFDKANRPITRLYQLGRALAPDQVDALFELLEGKIGGALRLLPLDKTKGLLKEQKDLPKPPEISGFLPAESEVPSDVIAEFPSLQKMYTDGSGLNPKQKGMLKSIFRKITGKMTGETEKDFVLDPEDKNFGALVEEVEAADEYYGTAPRAFYNKRSKDKRGRMYDLATGDFDLQELARQYPGKKNAGFRREVQALAADERFTLTNFVGNRGELIEDWLDGLEEIKNSDLVDPSRDLEAHHIRSIRHVGALVSGMNRKERAQFNRVMLRNMITVGHNKANLILLASGRLNDVHGRLHDKLDEKIGKYAEKLIDPNRTYTFSEKIEIGKRIGQITNRYTFEAYEEMADYLDDLMTQVSPSANMAANIDIAELEARLDYQIDELTKLINREGYADIVKAINNLPGSSVGDSPIPSDYEDVDPSVYKSGYTRLTRGPGKKTIENQRLYERLYGKQGSLFNQSNK